MKRVIKQLFFLLKIFVVVVVNITVSHGLQANMKTMTGSDRVKLATFVHYSHDV